MCASYSHRPLDGCYCHYILYTYTSNCLAFDACLMFDGYDRENLFFSCDAIDWQFLFSCVVLYENPTDRPLDTY